MDMDVELDKLKIDIGKRLKKCRNRLGLTQAELAERVGLQTQSYGNVEYGRSLISVPILMNLVHELDTSADYILFGFTMSESPLNELLAEMNSDDLERVEQIIALYNEAVREKRDK